MKILVFALAIVMIMSTVSSYHTLTQPFRNSQDVFTYVTNGEHQIYILFLYNGNWAADEAHHLKARYDMEKKDLTKLIEKYGRDIHFSEINVNSGDFRDLLQELGVNSVDLDRYPVTAVVDDSHGVWVHGPREYHRIAKIIEDFAGNPDSHWY